MYNDVNQVTHLPVAYRDDSYVNVTSRLPAGTATARNAPYDRNNSAGFPSTIGCHES